MVDSPPPRRPMGERTASTITTSRMAVDPTGGRRVSSVRPRAASAAAGAGGPLQGRRGGAWRASARPARPDVAGRASSRRHSRAPRRGGRAAVPWEQSCPGGVTEQPASARTASHGPFVLVRGDVEMLSGARRGDQRPRALALDDQGQVEQQRVLVVAADDLHARRAARRPCRSGSRRRVADDVGGIVSAPLFSGPTCTSPTRVFSVTSAGKATSGLVAAMTKSTSSNTAAMASLASVRLRLGLGRRLEVHQRGRRTRGRRRSRRSGRPCSRAKVAEVGEQRRQVADRPTRRRGRAASTGDVDDLEAGVLGQGLAGRAHAAPRPRAARSPSRASGRSTTRLPRIASRCVPRSRSQPSMRGQRVRVAACRSPSSTSYQRATSRTERARQPSDDGDRGDHGVAGRGGCARRCPSCRPGR